jgi:hypothetical protein
VKIPEKVKVLSTWYKVEWADKLFDGEGDALYGKVSYADGVITLWKHMPPSFVVETFLHEVMHAVEHSTRENLEEESIARMAATLAAVLVDNGLLKEEEWA